MDELFCFETTKNIRILHGSCLDLLPTFEAGTYHTCVTSPPYYNQRDYGVAGQLGLETTPGEYLANLVRVFREVHRVLRDDGTLWLNIGDGYATKGYVPWNIKPKDMFGIPWRLAFALQAAGWFLRQDVIWQKPDTMPEPSKSRCVKSHEYIFLLSKQADYYFDWEAIRERGVSGSKSGAPQRNTKATHGAQSGGNGGLNAAKVKMQQEYETNGFVMRNKRSVWTVSVQGGGSTRNEHFATFPPDLITPCILAGCPENGTVLDPFGGSGTTGVAARDLRRKADLIELNPDYVSAARMRIFGS